jgi:hypothetical protein
MKRATPLRGTPDDERRVTPLLRLTYPVSASAAARLGFHFSPGTMPIDNSGACFSHFCWETACWLRADVASHGG